MSTRSWDPRCGGIPGLPELGGVNLLDIDLRPAVDLNQRIGLDPTLMVDLTFDELIRTHEVQKIASEPYGAQGLVLQNDPALRNSRSKLQNKSAIRLVFS